MIKRYGLTTDYREGKPIIIGIPLANGDWVEYSDHIDKLDKIDEALKFSFSPDRPWEALERVLAAIEIINE